MNKGIIKEQIKASIATKQAILENDTLMKDIWEAAQLITEAYRQGHKVMFAGNGGSAGDAQHLAGELVNRFYFDRPGLAGLALTTDTSVMTAIGNDYDFNIVFARQLQALGQEGDIFIGISTSGNSSNILAALEECKRHGIRSIGLTGETGGKMKDLCDICLMVPSRETPRIQESHILIGHILCCIVEENIFG